jgi:hypothetical protein
MNQFLDAIKVDLLDRRRRPLLILALAALIGAVAYAALASGSSSSSGQSSPSPEPTLGAAGVHVIQGQPNGDQAVAETTSGAGQQHGGHSRDPFAPLPGVEQAANSKSASSTAASSTTTTTTSAASGGGSASGGAGSGSSPAPTRHTHVKTTYRVSVLFGRAAPGTPAAEANLTPYENLKLNQLIPSKKQPLVAFRGVVVGSGGVRSVAFTLVGEAIPRGPGVCHPSAVACQTLNLEVGQAEELEFLLPNGETVNYLLEPASIVFVTTAKAAKAASHSYGAGVSPAGSALLRSLGLVAVSGFRYSPRTKLLYAPAPAHAASRARSALHRG